jgi:hypothetical protein
MKKAVLLFAIAALTASCGWFGQKKAAVDASGTNVETGVIVAESSVDAEPPATGWHDIHDEAFDIERIDSVRYFAAKANAPAPPQVELEVITDIEKAKEMLAGRVFWGEWDDDAKVIRETASGTYMYEMRAKNGEIWSDGHLNKYMFAAYYPQEDIVMLEEGDNDIDPKENLMMLQHYAIVESFDMTTGEGTYSVGIPDYNAYSPSRQYRTNNTFSGREGSWLFIQIKDGNRYRKIIQLNDEFLNMANGVGLSKWSGEFWLSDIELYFIIEDLGYEPPTYCRLILK